MGASISFSESASAIRHYAAMAQTNELDRDRGARIRFLRRDVLGLGSQTELAAALSVMSDRGVSRGAVGNWERGADIAVDNVRALADLAGTTFDWIMEGRGEPPAPVGHMNAVPRQKPPISYSIHEASAFFDDAENRRRFEGLPEEDQKRISRALQAVFDATVPKPGA